MGHKLLDTFIKRLELAEDIILAMVQRIEQHGFGGGHDHGNRFRRRAGGLLGGRVILGIFRRLLSRPAGFTRGVVLRRVFATRRRELYRGVAEARGSRTGRAVRRGANVGGQLGGTPIE
jgi:hypothetical protein